MMRFYTFLFILLLFVGCKSSQKAKEVLPTKPAWLTERPLSSTDYIGIGSAQKYGPEDVYKNKARQKALTDIASQINSKVNSVSVLYQVEDKKKVNEILQNRIESKSDEFLEGYVLVDSYDAGINYYEYYRLSKQLFFELKEKRKTEALQHALQQFKVAESFADAGNAMKRIAQYARVLEILDIYLNDNTTVSDNGKEVNLNSEALSRIKESIRQLTITSKADSLSASINGAIRSTELAFVVSVNGVVEPQVPVVFEVTSNYLRNDKVLTNELGIASTEIDHFQSRKQEEIFCCSIDVEMISRLVTKNIAIRMLIKGKSENQKCVRIVVR